MRTSWRWIWLDFNKKKRCVRGARRGRMTLNQRRDSAGDGRKVDLTLEGTVQPSDSNISFFSWRARSFFLSLLVLDLVTCSHVTLEFSHTQ